MASAAAIAAGALGAQAGSGLIGTIVSGVSNKANREAMLRMHEEELAFNRQEAQATRDFNSAEAARARAFEKEMSDTAVRRKMADAAAAGLNPYAVLGETVGQAATPSAAAASASARSDSSAKNPGASKISMSGIAGLAASARLLGDAAKNGGLKRLSQLANAAQSAHDYSNDYHYIYNKRGQVEYVRNDGAEMTEQDWKNVYHMLTSQ